MKTCTIDHIVKVCDGLASRIRDLSIYDLRRGARLTTLLNNLHRKSNRVRQAYQKFRPHRKAKKGVSFLRRLMFRRSAPQPVDSHVLLFADNDCRHKLEEHAEDNKVTCVRCGGWAVTE